MVVSSSASYVCSCKDSSGANKQEGQKWQSTKVTFSQDRCPIVYIYGHVPHVIAEPFVSRQRLNLLHKVRQHQY